MFCFTVALATVLSISPQNIAQKHIDLGNVTGNVIRTTEKIWHSVSTAVIRGLKNLFQSELDWGKLTPRRLI
jgi:hypothetical protein